MTPHARGESWQLFHGDCREVLASLPDCSVDSVVTDPPYELGFMGKAWDASGIAYNVDLWTECLRVLKPGGHLLAFGGTRTYHRMAVAIEDAGFEIRDSIHWLYGSGFPKSLDVSKAIDKQRHDREDIYRVTAWVRLARDAAGITNRDIDAAFGFAGMAGHWTSGKSQPAVPTLEQVPLLLDTLGVDIDDVPEDIRRLLWDLNGRKGQPGENWWKREVVGRKTSGIAGGTGKHAGEDAAYGFGAEFDVTAPATDAAKQWEGWGTALKPAHEPIVVARKPLIGTVAANVLTHGTGALNINGTRIASNNGYEKQWDKPVRTNIGAGSNQYISDGEQHSVDLSANKPIGGRWPANVILDDTIADDWARYFYCAKPSKRERTCEGTVANGHPTLKPLELMRWLVRLVTPPGGTVLEPFAGSGTTLMACVMEGFNSIGIEMTDDYLPIIEGRVAWALANMPEPSADQLSLLE